MLEQLQEHVTVTFYRLRDVVEWIWALKNSAVKDQPEASPEDPGKSKESKEEKESEMNRIRRRFKALFILLGVFLFLIFRDNRRQKKRLLEETSWLQVTQNLARPASAAMAAASAMSGMGGMGGMNGSNQMTGSMGMSGVPRNAWLWAMTSQHAQSECLVASQTAQCPLACAVLSVHRYPGPAQSSQGRSQIPGEIAFQSNKDAWYCTSLDQLEYTFTLRVLYFVSKTQAWTCPVLAPASRHATGQLFQHTLLPSWPKLQHCGSDSHMQSEVLWLKRTWLFWGCWNLLDLPHPHQSETRPSDARPWTLLCFLLR